MKEAIDETERRRAKQTEFNRVHGITPKSVIKEVREIIDGVYKGAESASQDLHSLGHVDLKDEKALGREIRETEKKMLECARDLDFEQAAVYRDRLEALKRLMFGADGTAGDQL